MLFLGTGTSTGVPMIGCKCEVCTSQNPRNKRKRASIYIQTKDLHIVVDTPPDFRIQALEYKIERVDALFYTHSHADHIFGFDDVRRFNTIQQCIIPAYGSPSTISDLRRIFNYVGEQDAPGVYRPQIEFREISEPFAIGSLFVTPLELKHGQKHTYGYRFNADNCSLGYVPDCHEMPEPTLNAFRGVDVMILDALRYRPHSTHLSISESLAILLKIGARKSYLIHMCHDVEHTKIQKELPEGVYLSYDGLTLEW